MALSQVIGYPCFRLRGHYFAIATIAIGEIIHTVAINWEFIGGARGLTLPIRKDSLAAFQFHGTKFIYYYIVLALMVVCFLVTWHIEREPDRLLPPGHPGGRRTPRRAWASR